MSDFKKDVSPFNTPLYSPIEQDQLKWSATHAQELQQDGMRKESEDILDAWCYKIKAFANPELDKEWDDIIAIKDDEKTGSRERQNRKNEWIGKIWRFNNWMVQVKPNRGSREVIHGAVERSRQEFY